MKLLLKSVILLVILSKLSANELPNNAFIYTKSSCLGPCPAYQVMIFENGTIIFNGINYVQQKGLYKIHDSSGIFQNILQILDEYNINDFRDSYGGDYSEEKVCKQQWTDHPTTTLSLQLDGKIKTIEYYHGCKGFEREVDLKAIEKQIDKVLNLESYIRMQPAH